MLARLLERGAEDRLCDLEAAHKRNAFEGVVKRAGGRKLIEASVGTLGTLRLFDLAADLTEARGLAPAEPDAVARLRGELETWRAALALAPLDALAGGGPAPEIDPAARERLRTLGYVQ